MNKIFLSFGLLFSFMLMAQDESTVPKNLEDEKVVIVSAYQPQLAKAEKVNIKPSSADIPQTKNDANSEGLQTIQPYDLTPNFIDLELSAPEMRPVALPKKDSRAFLDEDNYNFWLKAGFGNLRTPMLKISTNTGDKLSNGIYGLNVEHISSNAGDAKAFARNDIEFFGEQKNENTRISGKLNYDYDRYHYYGFNKDTFEFESKDIRINYQNIGGEILIDNRFQNLSNFEYAVGGKTNYLFTNLAAKELNVDLNTAIFRRWQNGLKIGGDVELSYTNNTDSLTLENESFENITLSLLPKASYKWQWGRADIGASALLDNDKFYAYPNIFVQLDAIRNVLGFYTGIEKKIQKNNLTNLSADNPFLNHTIDYKNSLIENRYAGVKMNISSYLAFDVRALWEITKKQAFYVNEIDDIFEDDKEFIVIYEPELDAKGVEAELNVFINKLTQLSAKVAYRDFTLQQEQEAWLLPAFSTELKLIVRPIDNLQIISDFFWYGKRFAYNPTKEIAVTRNPIFDVNVSANYTLTENIGVFLNANNLTLNKYQRFLYYPSYGLNFVGGITARF